MPCGSGCVGDAHRTDRSAAERGDVGGMLAGSAGDHDVDVVRRRTQGVAVVHGMFVGGGVLPLVLRRHAGDVDARPPEHRSEEHTSELQSLMRISYAVFCLKKKIKTTR